MDYIHTNLGYIPVEDYLEIHAVQNGFESYQELLAFGYSIDLSDELIVHFDDK